jgi:hypothetical protein
MSKLYKDNGFLSEYGDEVFREHLDKEFTILLNSAKDENEARLISSLIMKRIGDITSHFVMKLKKSDK